MMMMMMMMMMIPSVFVCWIPTVSVTGKLSTSVSFGLGESVLALATLFLEPLTVTSAPGAMNAMMCQGAQVQTEAGWWLLYLPL